MSCYCSNSPGNKGGPKSDTSDADEYDHLKQSFPRSDYSGRSSQKYEDSSMLDDETLNALTSLRQKACRFITSEIGETPTDSHISNSPCGLEHRYGGTNVLRRANDIIDYMPQSEFLKKMKQRCQFLSDNKANIFSSMDEGLVNDSYDFQMSNEWPSKGDNSYIPRDSPIFHFNEQRMDGRTDGMIYQNSSYDPGCSADERLLDHLVDRKHPSDPSLGRPKTANKKSEHISRSKKPTKCRGRRKRKSGSSENCESEDQFEPTLKKPHENSCERCWRYASRARSPVNKPDQKYDPNFRRAHSCYDFEGGDGEFYDRHKSSLKNLRPITSREMQQQLSPLTPPGKAPEPRPLSSTWQRTPDAQPRSRSLGRTRSPDAQPHPVSSGCQRYPKAQQPKSISLWHKSPKTQPEAFPTTCHRSPEPQPQTFNSTWHDSPESQSETFNSTRQISQGAQQPKSISLWHKSPSTQPETFPTTCQRSPETQPQSFNSTRHKSPDPQSQVFTVTCPRTEPQPGTFTVTRSPESHSQSFNATRHRSPGAQQPKSISLWHKSPSTQPETFPTTCQRSPETQPQSFNSTRHKSPDPQSQVFTTTCPRSPKTQPEAFPTTCHRSPEPQPQTFNSTWHESPEPQPQSFNSTLQRSPGAQPPKSISLWHKSPKAQPEAFPTTCQRSPEPQFQTFNSTWHESPEIEPGTFTYDRSELQPQSFNSTRHRSPGAQPPKSISLWHKSPKAQPEAFPTACQRSPEPQPQTFNSTWHESPVAESHTFTSTLQRSPGAQPPKSISIWHKSPEVQQRQLPQQRPQIEFKGQSSAAANENDYCYQCAKSPVSRPQPINHATQSPVCQGILYSEPVQKPRPRNCLPGNHYSADIKICSDGIDDLDITEYRSICLGSRGQFDESANTSLPERTFENTSQPCVGENASSPRRPSPKLGPIPEAADSDSCKCKTPEESQKSSPNSVKVKSSKSPAGKETRKTNSPGQSNARPSPNKRSKSPNKSTGGGSPNNSSKSPNRSGNTCPKKCKLKSPPSPGSRKQETEKSPKKSPQKSPKADAREVRSLEDVKNTKPPSPKQRTESSDRCREVSFSNGRNQASALAESPDQYLGLDHAIRVCPCGPQNSLSSELQSGKHVVCCHCNWENYPSSGATPKPSRGDKQLAEGSRRNSPPGNKSQTYKGFDGGAFECPHRRRANLSPTQPVDASVNSSFERDCRLLSELQNTPSFQSSFQGMSPIQGSPRKYFMFYMTKCKENEGDDVEVLVEELTQACPKKTDSRTKDLTDKMKKIMECPSDSMALRFQKGVSDQCKTPQSSRVLYF